MTRPEPLPPRQLQLQINISFGLPELVCLNRLDTWLTEVLEIPRSSPRPSLAEDWAWRALLLAREWLQIGQVPVFDAPAIVSLAPAPQPAGWTARVALALVENVQQSLYVQLLDAAFGLCAWAAGQPDDAENRRKFFAEIETFAKTRLRKTAVSGNSTMPVLRAAHARGIPFIHLGGGVYQLGWGSLARRIERSTAAADSAIGAKLSGNKALTAALLRAGGLPAPVHQAAATEDDAVAAARALGWPVVVKPAALNRGEGVTTDVADELTLRQAFKTAAADPRGGLVLVERQVPGVCHRLFIAGGALLYVVKRWPMSVRGDGVQTVAALVDREVADQERRPPWKRSEIRPLDELSRGSLAAAGLTPASVPAHGVLAPLRNIESSAWGGVDEDFSSRIHPDNTSIALQSVSLLGLHIAGVDLITTDITRPWHENGAIINEVNFSPLLGHGEISPHYVPAFLERLMPGNGRIPVEVFAGGEAAWNAAVQRWRALRGDGMPACLTNSVKTFSASGGEWIMNFDSLCQRIRALLLSAGTGGVVLAVQTDEFLHTGLPFDAVDALTWIDTDFSAFRQPGFPLPPARQAALAALLETWRRFG